jgi:hypothetical protein
MTDLEQKFLRTLRRGCGTDTDVATYLEALRSGHDNLLRTIWFQSTTTADWFLLGIYKGIACRLAEFLVIDNVAALAAQSQGAEKPLHRYVDASKRASFPASPKGSK